APAARAVAQRIFFMTVSLSLSEMFARPALVGGPPSTSKAFPQAAAAARKKQPGRTLRRAPRLSQPRPPAGRCQPRRAPRGRGLVAGPGGRGGVAGGVAVAVVGAGG